MISIVAADKNWGIGYKNKLPWKIPGEQIFFKETTMGHTIVMGRKTLGSLPGGKPLPGRRNIVLSRDKSRSMPGVEFVSSAKAVMAITGDEEVFVIGGEQIYRLLLPYCNLAYVTKVNGKYQTDTYFPDLDNNKNWKVKSESETIIAKNNTEYKICLYENTSIID